MASDIKVPGVGESVQEGMIESWVKKSGDWVEIDDILLNLETDKATVEVAAKDTGKLEILVQAGTVVKVGDVIGKIDTAASKAGESSTPKASKDSKESSKKETKSEEPVQEASHATNTHKKESGPAVRRMVEEHRLDESKIPSSGRGGRVTKGDVVEHLKKVPTASKEAPKAEAKPSHFEPLVSDSSQSKDRSERRTDRKPMSMLRRRIAERLLEAQSNAAILTTFNEVDMTNVMDLRNRYKDPFQVKYGIKLGFMGFFLKASVEALKAFPNVNAYIEGTDICYHNYCDIGVAVSTHKGLVVPVIKNIDQMTIPEIELSIADYATKARDNKINLDDLTGGTFTVSNGGVFGSLLSTPILNPPQTAILGMHKTQQRPMVMPDGSIAARPMMYVALSYDHRIIDGKEAVGFLVKIKENIEDPSRILLGV